MPRVPVSSLGSSRRRAPLGKRKALRGSRTLDANTSIRKRSRPRSTMAKREPSFLPDIGSLTRLPLATSRSTETSPHDDQDSESDDELPVIVTSENPPHRHISISSRSRTPSVVDLTNDSGLEDEDVIDLTTSFQIPTIDSAVPVSSGGHSIPPSVGAGRLESATAAEVVVVPESDDEVQFLSSSLPRSLPDDKPPRPNDHSSSSSLPTFHSPSPTISSPHKPPNNLSITCPVCMDQASLFESSGRKLVTTTCGHVFCDSCIRNAISSLHKCPVCSKKLSLKQYHRLFIS